MVFFTKVVPSAFVHFVHRVSSVASFKKTCPLPVDGFLIVEEPIGPVRLKCATVNVLISYRKHSESLQDRGIQLEPVGLRVDLHSRCHGVLMLEQSGRVRWLQFFKFSTL